MGGRGFGYDPDFFVEGGLIRSPWVTIGRFRSLHDADPINPPIFLLRERDSSLSFRMTRKKDHKIGPTL